MIEVLAALIILGSTVTIGLIAQGRSLSRIHSAERSLIAEHLAHEIVAAIALTDSESRPNYGAFEQFPGWSWRLAKEPIEMAGVTSVIQFILELAFSDGTTVPWRTEYRWIARDVQT